MRNAKSRRNLAAAERQAQRIRDYWRANGVTSVRVWIEPVEIKNQAGAFTTYNVQSNLRLTCDPKVGKNQMTRVIENASAVLAAVARDTEYADVEQEAVNLAHDLDRLADSL